MPRLFTALEAPPSVTMALSLLRGGLPGARWIDPGNYHVTLRFIGDVDERTAADVAEALGQVDRPSFEVVLDGLGSFGSRRPHSLHANVAVSPPLLELQSEHERIMQRLGLEPERRKFRPHVTLARLRGASAVAVADYLSMRGGFRTDPFAASRFVLLSSRDSRGGGPYGMEGAYPLSR